MKAALYCRVSTEEQRKSGYSLRQQIEALRRYCDAHDLEVVGEFEDRASGASLDRLGLDAFYRQAELRVKVGQETEISLDIGGTSVRKSARASGSTRSPTGTL
jgi:predicted site-specific integrase-resolvase